MHKQESENRSSAWKDHGAAENKSDAEEGELSGFEMEPEQNVSLHAHNLQNDFRNQRTKHRALSPSSQEELQNFDDRRRQRNTRSRDRSNDFYGEPQQFNRHGQGGGHFNQGMPQHNNMY